MSSPDPVGFPGPDEYGTVRPSPDFLDTLREDYLRAITRENTGPTRRADQDPVPAQLGMGVASPSSAELGDQLEAAEAAARRDPDRTPDLDRPLEQSYPEPGWGFEPEL